MAAIDFQMKRFLTITLLLISFETVQAQVLPEDVFLVGRHFKEDECRVETYPDWGTITFFTEKVFLAVLFVQSNDSSFLIGRYEVRDSVLHLERIQSAFPVWYADSVDNKKIEYFKKIKFENVDFKILSCENGDIIMRQLTKEKSWYASPDRTKRKYWIDAAKEEGLWERIASY